MTAIYFDHAATTPLDPRVRAAMEPWLGERFGNASSRHAAGVAAGQAIEHARGLVARAVGARKAEIVFTSGGTEANNLAVLGGARARRRKGTHVLLGPTEHASVREAAEALVREGFTSDTMQLDASGALDVGHAAEKLRPTTVLVAEMLVQNEVGTVYPVRELARLVRARAPHALVHVDAVQALGKLELSFAELGCDTLALSAHKLGGPQGAGALVVREGVELEPLVHGGGQERGLRSGTENVAAIVGLGAAAELAESERPATVARLRELREHLVHGLEQLPGARVITSRATAPHIVAVVLPGVPSEVRMHHLEELGVIVSAGSACQSKKSAQSPALTALGLSAEDARSLLRISFGSRSTPAEVDQLLAALAAVERKLAPVRR